MKSWNTRLWLFFVFWSFVIVVSVYDAFLALRFRDYLGSNELNPMGRRLLELNGGDVWLLLGVKLAGTVASATVLLVIYGRNSRVGLAVAAGLAALQMCLLLFLSFA